MRSFLARFERLKAGFWPGIACVFLVWLCLNQGWSSNIEKISLDALFKFRGTRFADPNIVIVAVDDDTVSQAGTRAGVGWPLPRRYYARAVRQLKGLGAKTIAFDVLFAGPGPKPDDDADFAKACREAGNVTQSVAFRFPEGNDLPVDVEPGQIPPKFSLGEHVFPHVRHAIQAIPPQPLLIAGAAGLGHLNVFPEPSGTLRRVPHLFEMGGTLYPSLSLASVSNFLGKKPILDPDSSQIRLEDHVIPVDSNGLTFVNWIGGARSYPTFGMTQLLDGTMPPEAIRGRLVIIGVTASGAYESKPTPFSGAVPAVDFQANAMDDILSDRTLQAVPPWVTLFFRLTFPMFCALLTARRSSAGSWPVPVIILALLALSTFLLIHNIVMPVGLAILGGFTAFAITSAKGYRREWESSARADASISSLARNTVFLSSAIGRDRDKLLSIIRRTARETLNAREVYLVLDEMPVALDERVSNAAQRAMLSGVGWVWPPGQGGTQTIRRRRAQARIDPETKAQIELWEGETVVSAPLPRANVEQSEAADGTLARVRQGRDFAGAIVAIGRRDGSYFTPRDAVLLETLAEGAALALENWSYSETLRGRIASTNLELSDAYQLLAEQSAKLFAAVESIDAAIVVADPNGNAIFVNPAGARVLRGATPILGEPVVSALSTGDMEELADLFADFNALGGQATAQRVETVRGSEILVAQFTPLGSEEGNFLGAMLVVSDVTAQRELDRMKTDFVGYVAHELRTPLTTILGYASLLDMSAGRFSPAEIRNMTGVISRHCRRMNGMISDLLDISRIESGAPLLITRRVFDLAALCERLLEEQKPYLNPTPVFEFVFDCPECPIEWNGDQDRLEQVLLNLLSNALKYSPDGGTITLSLHQSENELVLEVRDQGMGLSAQQCSHMFQKFYRTSDARARGIKGNGLGLNLVRQIVETHGGRIEVFSKRDEGEHGATFRVTLPLEEFRPSEALEVR